MQSNDNTEKLENFILDDVYDFVGRFVAFPDDHAKAIHTAWIAHTHLTEVFYTTPRLQIVSAVKGCGKTTLLQLTSLLSHNGLSMVSPSPASLYTLIEETHPTLLIDEIDRLFERRDTSDITAIIDAGFQRGPKVPRVTTEGKRAIEWFDVFGPMVIAGIDNQRLPDTVGDRSVRIGLKRKLLEKVEPFRPRKHQRQATELRERLARWAVSIMDKAKEMDDPAFPPQITGRLADKWEPLFIVADVADVADAAPVADKKLWSKMIRDAAISSIRDQDATETVSTSEALLQDIRTVIHEEEKIASIKLIDRLASMQESDWSAFEYSNKPISPRTLSKLLKPFGIKSKQIRFDVVEDGEVKQVNERGYYRSSFEDAWRRYLPCIAATSAADATPATDQSLVSREASTLQRFPTTPLEYPRKVSTSSTLSTQKRTASDDTWDRWVSP